MEAGRSGRTHVLTIRSERGTGRGGKREEEMRDEEREQTGGWVAMGESGDGSTRWAEGGREERLEEWREEARGETGRRAAGSEGSREMEMSLPPSHPRHV